MFFTFSSLLLFDFFPSWESSKIFSTFSSNSCIEYCQFLIAEVCHVPSEHIFVSCVQRFICENIIVLKSFVSLFLLFLFVLLTFCFLPFSLSLLILLSFFLHLLLTLLLLPLPVLPCALLLTWALFLGCPLTPAVSDLVAHERWLEVLCLWRVCGVGLTVGSRYYHGRPQNLRIWYIFSIEMPSYLKEDLRLFGLEFGGGGVREKPGHQHPGTWALKGTRGDFLQTLHCVSSLPFAPQASLESSHPSRLSSASCRMWGRQRGTKWSSYQLSSRRLGYTSLLQPYTDHGYTHVQLIVFQACAGVHIFCSSH